MDGDGKVNSREIWRESFLVGMRVIHGRGLQGKCWRGVEGGKILTGSWCRGTVFARNAEGVGMFVSDSNGLQGNCRRCWWRADQKGGNFSWRGVCKDVPCNDPCQLSPCSERVERACCFLPRLLRRQSMVVLRLRAWQERVFCRLLGYMCVFMISLGKNGFLASFWSLKLYLCTHLQRFVIFCWFQICTV